MQVNKRDLLTQQAGAANSTAEGTSKMLKFSELLNVSFTHQLSLEGSRVGWFIMVNVLNWNVKSFLANGKKSKQFIKEMAVRLDTVCVQEKWF